MGNIYSGRTGRLIVGTCAAAASAVLALMGPMTAQAAVQDVTSDGAVVATVVYSPGFDVPPFIPPCDNQGFNMGGEIVGGLAASYERDYTADEGPFDFSAGGGSGISEAGHSVPCPETIAGGVGTFGGSISSGAGSSFGFSGVYVRTGPIMKVVFTHASGTVCPNPIGFSCFGGSTGTGTMDLVLVPLSTILNPMSSFTAAGTWELGAATAP